MEIWASATLLAIFLRWQEALKEKRAQIVAAFVNDSDHQDTICTQETNKYQTMEDWVQIYKVMSLVSFKREGGVFSWGRLVLAWLFYGQIGNPWCKLLMTE